MLLFATASFTAWLTSGAQTGAGVMSWWPSQTRLQGSPVFLIAHPEIGAGNSRCISLVVLETDFLILNPHNMSDKKKHQNYKSCSVMTVCYPEIPFWDAGLT